MLEALRDSMESEAIAAAGRASARVSVLIHAQLKRGVNSLATVVSIAPWVGVLGTLFGIVGSFRGGDGEKSTLMALLCQSLSEAIVPCAFGIAVAVIALGFYKYLQGQIEAFDTEMETTSLGLMNALSRVHTN
jgi:biopolymer transport protein ExbB/TolQ